MKQGDHTMEKHAKAVSKALKTLSKGQLNCLPYTRALLDHCEALGITAKPLVVRAIVFGSVKELTWDEVFKLITPAQLFLGARDGQHANGGVQLTIPSDESSKQKQLVIPYRTLGYTHGTAPMGDYDAKGNWSGHIVAIAGNALIDMTIGQLNDSQFNIHFDPPFVMVETDSEFLAGTRPIIGEQDGMVVCYQAYPSETTFLQSRSWSDPGFRKQLREAGTKAAEYLKRKA